MGTDENEVDRVLVDLGGEKLWFVDEIPKRTVQTASFHIDTYEVTNAQYKDFLDKRGHRAPAPWANGTYPAGTQDHPVTHVSWFDAKEGSSGFSVGDPKR